MTEYRFLAANLEGDTPVIRFQVGKQDRAVALRLTRDDAYEVAVAMLRALKQRALPASAEEGK